MYSGLRWFYGCLDQLYYLKQIADFLQLVSSNVGFVTKMLESGGPDVEPTKLFTPLLVA